MASLQIGSILSRHFGNHQLWRVPSAIATTFVNNHAHSATVNHRCYSKKSDDNSMTPSEIDKTALEKAKDAIAKIKSAKRKWDLNNPCNDKIQPTMEENQVPPRIADVVIVGGGIMGSSIAYHLTQQSMGCDLGLDVLVIEKDPSYTKASTVLSCGGIRQQFSIPENVKMSMYSAKFLRESKYLLTVDGKDLTDVQFNHQGYLFLASEAGVEVMQNNFKVQRECGASVELLTPKQIKEKFPWINTEGVALGSYGLENEGWFDPWSLLRGFRQKAVAQGARYINGEVLGFNVLQPGKKDNMVDQTYAGFGRKVRGVKMKSHGIDEIYDVDTPLLILACGHNMGNIGRQLGIGEGEPEDMMDIPIPVEPRKRYVYVVHAPDGPGVDCPFLIDYSGAYMRREGFGGNYICGLSPEFEADEPPIDDLEVDYDWFNDRVWPKLAKRVPAMENLKVRGAWAGYYDYNTIDQNAIVGRHPAFPNLFMATGFTGHGIQQSPAVGKYMRDLIIEGTGDVDLDLERFGFERFIYRQPLREANVV